MGGIERQVRLAAGDVEVLVDLDAGARAIDWTVGGVALLARRGAAPEEHGMYPMAPWAGRLRGNSVTWAGQVHPLPVTFEGWAMHGTGLAQSARVIDLSQGGGVARLLARVDDHPGWPWPMAVDIGWEVGPREVTTTIAVHALTEAFPAVVGWHPWFRRQLDSGGPLQWSIEATERFKTASCFAR